MNQAFDRPASAYDREFTFSRIGTAQRHAVWRYLATLLHTPSMQVLELNCGTGTDAVHFAQHGHEVLATDISAEMIQVATEKVKQYGAEDRVQLKRMSFEELGDRPFGGRFDLVFSNFGGLNCIDRTDLARLLADVDRCLCPGGRFIAVVMPDRCVAETVYFFLKGQLKEAFRRGRHEPIWAGLSGSGVMTWYHSPRTFSELAAPLFKRVAVRPIGFFVPPSYLEPRFHDKPKLLSRLARWDDRIPNWGFLARYSDHFLIDLEKRG
ncbi:MAG: class I SAM-dependent methyltransferase [Flavobacteriales bacterium]|nr:class I SAM-dependent methyltransferase [Flavobacteriales bacterium]